MFGKQAQHHTKICNISYICAFGLAWLFCAIAPSLFAIGLPAELPTMPEVPEQTPADSVEMGIPADFNEVKMDFPIEDGFFEFTWPSISGNYPGDPTRLREAKFGIGVHYGPHASDGFQPIHIGITH